MVIDRIVDEVRPVPVAMLLVPVLVGGREGLLVVRRMVPPLGLALPGCAVDERRGGLAHAARRMLLADAGVEIAGDQVTWRWIAAREPRPARVLVLGVGPALAAESLPRFAPTRTSAERGAVFGAGGLDDRMSSPLHTAAARQHLAARGIAGRCDYRPI